MGVLEFLRIWVCGGTRVSNLAYNSKGTDGDYPASFHKTSFMLT